MELTASKYKQTEVGLIPEDWEVFGLSHVLNRIADVDHYMPKTEKYGIPYVMTGDLKELAGDIDFDNCKKISATDYKKLSKKIKSVKGDIILARYATVGTVSFVNIDFDFIVSYSCVTIKPNTSKLFGLFLYYYFKSNVFKLEVKNKVNANIQDNVGIGDLAKMKIPLPPTLSEQKSIAQVLSDTDALIQALEKKITKKKLIKKGVIQKLLTPKDNWKESKVSSIGKPYGGMSGKTKADFSNGNAHYVPFMNVMSNPIIDTGYLDSVKIHKGESQNKILKGDLLFNGSSETPEEVGFCSALLEEIDNLYLNSFCFGFRVHDTKQYDSLFLAYFFRSTLGRKFFYSLAQGATRYNLSKTNFLKSKLSLPVYEDQVQIAAIIRDMESEIENLELKLSKYQLAKKGMMQQLLTGKIRLV